MIVAYALRELDAPQAVQDPHDLFLIDHHAVGFFEDFLEHGMQVSRLLAAVLDVDVLVDHAAVQGAGAIEGVGGDDVGEAVRLHLDQEVADAGRLELEDALGLAALQELEGLGVVERQTGRGRSATRDARSLMSRTAARGGRQVAQAEEVHLQEPGLLDVAHLPLGGDDLLGLVFVGDLLQRHELFERPVGDHHAGGVGADVAVHPFEPPGEIEQPRDLGIFIGHPPQRGLFLEGFVEGDVEPRRGPAC